MFRSLSLRACMCFVLSLALPVSHIGCGRSDTSFKFDRTLAQSSVRTFLDTWRAGKPLAALKECQPPLVANDEEWAAGHRLVAYKVIDDSFSDGLNLHVETRLTVAPRRGRPTEKEVTFIVGTHPLVTVFRK
jgi:hypothetical protein